MKEQRLVEMDVTICFCNTLEEDGLAKYKEDNLLSSYYEGNIKEKNNSYVVFTRKYPRIS
jgi:hypothetical protein